jgi:hypothetical protein
MPARCLIYRLAVGAVAANGFAMGSVAPAFLLAVVGSLVAGPVLAALLMSFMSRVEHVPDLDHSSIVTTFGVWILAERIGLSGVLTMVCYAITIGAKHTGSHPRTYTHSDLCRLGHVVFALNILAFILSDCSSPDSGKSEAGQSWAISGGAAAGTTDRHSGALRLAHVFQPGCQVAGSRARLSSAAADCCVPRSGVGWSSLGRGCAGLFLSRPPWRFLRRFLIAT